MSVAPATEPGADESGGKRRIGDILLELGFVTDEALSKATEEQDRTGQPLGQILVEQGAITRLELASALAEQWSDQVSISPLPLPTGPPRIVPPQPVHHDDDQYAARLQEAVADLTQRVRLPDENPVDGRLVDLAERLESTVARTQRLEATVATLFESLEGMTSGVEEAFGVLQSGMSGLAIDLARIETTVTELTARPAEPAVDPALAARVDSLWNLVHELAERPLVDDDARGRADALAARLDAVADRAELEEVQGSIHGLRASLGDLDELRAAVSELGSLPAGSAEIDEGLERLEAALAAQSALEATLRTLDQRLDAVARDVATRAEASLAEQVASVENRLAALQEPDPRVDELARGLVSLRDELHATTAARLEAVEARLEAELAASTDPEAAKALAALSERIEELSRERHHLEDVAARLDRIESRLPTDTVSAPELAAALERMRAELEPAPHKPDPRVDALAPQLGGIREELYEATAARLQALEARLEAGLASSTDPEAAEALAALSERIEELSRERHAQAGLAARLEALEARLEAGLASSKDPEAEEALATLSGRIEDLARERDAQDELLARLAALEAHVPADTVTAAELSAIDERVAEIARTVEETLAAASAEAPGEPSGVPESVQEDLERFRMTLERLNLNIADHDRALTEMRSSRGVSARIEELAARVDALATGAVAAPAPDGAAPRRREPSFSRDLEANEMRQLIRRIEDCEEAAHEGREKLMNRLERMASSIDWRLQRLEAAGDEASASE